jgi:hypothetical protein
MSDLPGRAARLLRGRGHVWLGEPEPPRAVTLRPNQTAVVASLEFAGGVRHVVVKSIPEHANIPCPEKLREVHDGLRARGARLAGGLPRFAGVGREERLLVMEFVDGRPLEDVLKASLRSPVRRDDPGEVPLRETAALEAEMHRVCGADVGLAGPYPNRSYLPGFEAAWKHPSVARVLPLGLRDARRLYDLLPPSFFDRAGDRVMAGDIQPKNVIVREGGGVCLIDLDYTAGNPAIGVAQFLVALDRLGTRCPLGPPLRRIASWKQQYLAAYLEGSPHSVAEDLSFFYPSLLVQHLLEHSASRPWLRRYLVAYYGRRLREFLRRLGGDGGRSPVVATFAGLDAPAVTRPD